jgi:hypothetical protein
MKYTNRIIPAGLIGEKQQHILSGKPTDNPNVSVYLLNAIDEEEPINAFALSDYSLWNVETLNDDEFRLWPYEGADYEDLIIQLGKTYLEEAFLESNAPV